VSRRPLIALPLAVALALAGACSKDEAERDGRTITDGGSISVFQLRPGDCLDPGTEAAGEVDTIQAVPCDDPHTQEVFAVLDYPADEGDAYPGEADIREFADASCLEAFGEYTGSDYADSTLYFSYLRPSADSWKNTDDRQVVCVIVAKDEQMTGSVRDTPS
jgi:hypothetical protein